MIELIDIDLRLGGRAILRSFNLHVGAVERVVLLGPSGCGKTTVLRLIAGFAAPDHGSVLLNNRIVTEGTRIAVPPEQRGLGYVFQDLALWPHMTVFENVEFALRMRRVPPLERERAVVEMLKLVDLERRRSSLPSELSGGEQQRVAIARALIGAPEAVLMDEPLSNLDDDLRTSLCRGLRELQERLGFALVYVTHSKMEAGLLEGRLVQMPLQ